MQRYVKRDLRFCPQLYNKNLENETKNISKLVDKEGSKFCNVNNIQNETKKLNLLNKRLTDSLRSNKKFEAINEKHENKFENLLFETKKNIKTEIYESPHVNDALSLISDLNGLESIQKDSIILSDNKSLSSKYSNSTKVSGRSLKSLSLKTYSENSSSSSNKSSSKNNEESEATMLNKSSKSDLKNSKNSSNSSSNEYSISEDSN